MLFSVLAIFAIGIAIYYIKRWQKMPKLEQKKYGRQVLLWSGAAIVLALVVTGRAHWLMGVLATLAALASRLAQFAQYIPLFQKLFGKTESNSPNQAPAKTHAMSRQDAADILGIDVKASEEEVRLAHKKLMQKIHPDRGGSDALASQINQAKDILLG